MTNFIFINDLLHLTVTFCINFNFVLLQCQIFLFRSQKVHALANVIFVSVKSLQYSRTIKRLISDEINVKLSQTS